MGGFFSLDRLVVREQVLAADPSRPKQRNARRKNATVYLAFSAGSPPAWRRCGTDLQEQHARSAAADRLDERRFRASVRTRGPVLQSDLAFGVGPVQALVGRRAAHTGFSSDTSHRPILLPNSLRPTMASPRNQLRVRRKSHLGVLLEVWGRRTPPPSQRVLRCKQRPGPPQLGQSRARRAPLPAHPTDQAIPGAANPL